MELPAFLDPIVNLPKQHKLIIGFAGLALIGGLSYYLVFAPAQAQILGLEKQYAGLKAEIAQNRANLATLEALKKQAGEVEQKLAALTEKLPSEKEMPQLYRTIHETAYQSALDVALFQPRDPRIRDYYAEIPITLTAEGSYHQIGAFFDRLSGLPRIVTVNDWKFLGLVKNKNTMRAELTLATYTYRPVGSPAPPKPVTK
jgi:type IV pilus assembly protein PilO